MKKNGANYLFITLLLGAALLLRGDFRPKNSELETALSALLWKPGPPADPDDDTTPNPGWYNPGNRQVVARFIAKYPNTEEAYLAEVWLIFANAQTDSPRLILDWKQRRKADAEALKRIIIKTASSRTAKIAKITRACVLDQAGEHEQLRTQVDEILSRIREYETEKDEQFLKFAEVTETPPCELEPYLRRMRVISECHQHHLNEALALAEALRVKYPQWGKREGINGDIELLKRGESPFPTWKEMNAGL